MSAGDGADERLIDAVMAGDLAAAQAAVADGASVRVQDNYGQEPLHLACLQGHLEIAQWLHSAGASLNATYSTHGETPLHFACLKGHLEVAQWLCSAGADTFLKPISSGSTSLSGSWSGSGMRLLDVQLFDAVEEGDLAAAQAAVANGASVSAQDEYGQDLLYLACLNGHLDIAQWLHSAGAPFDATTNDGQTPLHSACYHGRLGVAQWLHSVGALLDASNCDGETPLHLACWSGNLEIAQWLCSIGSDATYKSNDGETPAQLLQRPDRTVQLDQQALRSTLACLVRRAQAQGPPPSAPLHRCSCFH